MVGVIKNSSVPSLGYTLASGSKMSLPVDSSALMYSHFEHVSGMAAPEGTHGVSISKLNLLDVLIGQLNRIKKAAPFFSPAGTSQTDHADALIEHYRNLVREAKASSQTMPYTLSPGGRTGSVFDLTA